MAKFIRVSPGKYRVHVDGADVGWVRKAPGNRSASGWDFGVGIDTFGPDNRRGWAITRAAAAAHLTEIGA